MVSGLSKLRGMKSSVFVLFALTRKFQPTLFLRGAPDKFCDNDSPKFCILVNTMSAPTALRQPAEPELQPIQAMGKEISLIRSLTTNRLNRPGR